MLSTALRGAHPLHGDVYVMRVAHATSTLWINHDHVGLQGLRAATGEVVSEIAFPASGEPFLIYGWMLSNDGRQAVLLSSDPLEYGLHLSLDMGLSRRFALPKDFPVLSNLYWFAPDFHALDYSGKIWRLERDRLVLAPSEVYDLEPVKEYLAIQRAWNVSGPDRRSGGWFVAGKEQDVIGYLPRLDEKPVLARRERYGDISRLDDVLLVCAADRIVQSEQGHVALLLQPPGGCSFRGVDVLELGGKPHLVALVAADDSNVAPSGYVQVHALSKA